MLLIQLERQPRLGPVMHAAQFEALAAVALQGVAYGWWKLGAILLLGLGQRGLEVLLMLGHAAGLIQAAGIGQGVQAGQQQTEEQAEGQAQYGEMHVDSLLMTEGCFQQLLSGFTLSAAQSGGSFPLTGVRQPTPFESRFEYEDVARVPLCGARPSAVDCRSAGRARLGGGRDLPRP